MVRSLSRVFLLAGIAAAAAACGDNLMGPRPTPPEVAPPPILAALQCRMDVRAESLACGPTAPNTASGISALIIGGQGTHVRLTSSGTSYDAGTGILRSEVTVENLLAKALGTDDGVFPSPQGVRVFFHTGPTTNAGSGQVTLANADGEALFTAAAQSYFQYDGLLAPGDTSDAREWRFSVPATVESFLFTVFVSAAVPGEAAPGAGIFLLGGAGLADTVDATPGSLLRVGVRGANGKPAAYRYVEVRGAPADPYYYTTEMLVGSLHGGYFGSSTSGVTDSLGIVEFRVRLGTRAGPQRVVVSAPELALTDTARYTALPGRASSIQSLPADTTLSFDGRAPLRVSVLDRYGNARADTAVVTVLKGPGTAEGTEVVAGSSIGRITAVVAAGALRDTSYATVVPKGTIAAAAGQGSALYVFSLDGSDVRRVRTTIIGEGSYNGDMAVAWLSPTKLVYHDNNYDHTKQLYTLDLQTGKAARFLSLRDWMEMESHPKVSRDGQWVYFSGGTYSAWSLFRARADGAGKEPITFTSVWSSRQWGIDPSPDGTRVVFVREGDYDAGEIFIGEIGASEARPLDLKGVHPRWSPDGSRIAFVATPGTYAPSGGPAAVVNADGSDARAVTLSRIVGGVDWSPDGKYIIGSVGDNRIVIIDVATEEEVIVSYPELWGVKSPVWQP